MSSIISSSLFVTAKAPSHFVLRTSVQRRDKEARSVSGIRSTHLAASFSSTLSDVTQNDVISRFLADWKMQFRRLKEKRIEKQYYTPFTTVQSLV